MTYWPRNEDTAPIIFIHIPKTAGSSIRNWFKLRYKKFEKSMHADVNHPVVSRLIEKMPSFCVVRNPFDLVYSWYRYKIQMLQEVKHYDREEFNAWHKGFDYWLENYFHKINFSDDKFLKDNKNKISPSKTQLEYISNNNVVKVEHICRFENLNKDIEKINNIVGGCYQIIHANKSNLQKNYKKEYSQSSRVLVESIYKNDLNFWDYDF